MDASGIGGGAILNEDSFPNGVDRPARSGSVIVLYATGGGLTGIASEDGRIATTIGNQVEPVRLRIGGLDAEVLHAGPAPGLVAGVMQVNARVPAALAGGWHSMELIAGERVSRSGVLVAVASGLP